MDNEHFRIKTGCLSHVGSLKPCKCQFCRIFLLQKVVARWCLCLIIQWCIFGWDKNKYGSKHNYYKNIRNAFSYIYINIYIIYINIFGSGIQKWGSTLSKLERHFRPPINSWWQTLLTSVDYYRNLNQDVAICNSRVYSEEDLR